MRKIILLLLFFAMIFPCPAEGRGGGMGGSSDFTPKVAYSRPADESVLDLTGKDKVVFEWQMVPIPSGSREVFKFTLFKGNGYEEVMSRTIDPQIFSIEVPADKFENGASYRWYVKQRDARTMVWSQHDDWYFKVIGK